MVRPHYHIDDKKTAELYVPPPSPGAMIVYQKEAPKAIVPAHNEAVMAGDASSTSTESAYSLETATAKLDEDLRTSLADDSYKAKSDTIHTAENSGLEESCVKATSMMTGDSTAAQAPLDRDTGTQIPEDIGGAEQSACTIKATSILTGNLDRVVDSISESDGQQQEPEDMDSEAEANAAPDGDQAAQTVKNPSSPVVK